MDKLRKILGLLVFVPLGVVLVVLAVANRQPVTLALNPFRPEDGILSVTAPFFLFIFASLLFGMLLGSLVTWWRQGKHRKRARVEAREVAKLKSEYQAAVAGSGHPQLPSR